MPPQYHPTFSGESWEEADKKGIKWLCYRDDERYIATIKDDTHSPEPAEQNLPSTCAPANETFPVTGSGEPSPMSAYSWVSGKKGKTYLMPDDQKWINERLEPLHLPAQEHIALMREHQRIYLETYQQKGLSELERDPIARRAANSWLLDITSNKI